MNEYLTLHEVADLLNLNYWTVRAHVASGTIPAKKIGGAWRVSRAELEEWMKKKSVAS